MLKVIGALTLVAGAVVGFAVWQGSIEVHPNAAVTTKGQAQLQELRNKAADQIRGVADSAANATAGEKK